MDKTEKIRAEIARLKGQLIRGACAAQIEMETNCKDEAYNEVLAFLDTLSDEPDKSLEEEVKNYFQGYWPGTDTPEQCNTDLHFTSPAILRLARHFADWQNERMAKSMPLPEDTVLFQKGVAEGRRLEREDMMKGAVEFECIGKKVKMTVEELINYYIDTECCEVADECGF